MRLRCPNCERTLERTQSDRGGIFWSCSGCGGRTVGVALLRRLVEKRYVDEIWSSTHDAPGSKRGCPSCGNEMRGVRARDGGGAELLDACRPCQLVWFDPTEFETLPSLPRPPAPPAIPQDRLEDIAREQAQHIADRYAPAPGSDFTPMGSLPGLWGFLGLPAEEEQGFLERSPWVTWVLAAVMTLASSYALADPSAVESFGLVPSETFRAGGLTFLTSFFMHSSILQLLAAVYFLVAFGDNTEDLLGSLNYALLVVVAVVVGGAAHTVFASDPNAPFVGGGAGIAGIVFFYGLKFPRRRLRYFFSYGSFGMPAAAIAVVWLLAQWLGNAGPTKGPGRTSLAATVAGGLVGVLFWWVWRDDESG